MMAWFHMFWSDWLEAPLGLLKEYLGFDLTVGWYLLAYKVAAVCLLLLLLFEVYLRIRLRIRRLRDRIDFFEVHDTATNFTTDPRFADTIEAARNLKGTVAALKKAKRYDRLGEVYASVQHHKDAAKWFHKAGDFQRAATEWARAGQTLRAAKLLMKAGDYAGAARFFQETGRHAAAAGAYVKMNDLPSAATAYANAGQVADAGRVFADYFATAQGPPQAQLAATDACYALLTSEAGRAQISPETRTALLPALAARFEQARRFDLAASLYYEARETAKAGEVYAQAGNLAQAAKCMREAGNTKDANLVAARYHESREQWREAGTAYAAAGEFRRAGACFGKVNDAAHAAECYEKAGEYYGAALAYSHLRRFEDAVRLLQKIKESDKSFDLSRALLGRCFYELHDFPHCAATLDNHLTGKRVESGNTDYFYMLALAYEQLGELEKSRAILYKIRSVNIGFKDVTQRLSNISSRISMGVDAVTVKSEPRTQSADETHVMQMVENLLQGRYRLDRELGRGGMGVVYLARDTQLERPVALKFLGSLVDGSEEYRQRFVREAKAAARVSHPNIIAIYDISANLGKAYIAMEYVDGPNLHRYVGEKGPLSSREAINIMCQACSALDAIHEAGIVHRDLKPDNILLGKGGLVKLTDFGLAKADSARITDSNVVMGTPAYMSPEQSRGAKVDARSDIYSMGLILHEILAGQTVFKDGDVLYRQQNEIPPPPSALTGGVPPKLDAIVMKCVEKDPQKRFQSAADLLAALRDAEA